MTTAYIGLGSNLGDRKSFINKALKMLVETENIRVARASDIIETTPLGGVNQPGYLNAAAKIETSLTAEKLLKTLVDIETSLGRAREGKWSSRTIDLDLLLFGNEVINSPDLTVPHSQMHLRSFVLKGLCQLDGNLLHPVIKEPMKELANRLNGEDFVLHLERPQLVSVAGIIGVGKTTLAKKLSELFDCKLVLEPYDTNPFMPDVYAGHKELALDSQLFFLNNRVEQLNRKILEAGQIVVSDYVFDKELIYARRLLNSDQLASYEEIYPSSVTEIAPPVMVIYLTDSAEHCLQRIHNRNRPYEQRIEPQFLEALNSDYEQLFAGWKTCPVIRISASEFIKNGDIDHLKNQIKSYIAV